MRTFLNEFKEFIARGNVMDMAVGIIVGGAFTAIVNSLVSDIITPVIKIATAALTGGVELTQSGLVFRDPTDAASVDLAAFVGQIINFLIIAFVVFCMVKALNAMRGRMDAVARKVASEKLAASEQQSAAAPHCPHCLEEVKPGATRCPHCTSAIDPAA